MRVTQKLVIGFAAIFLLFWLVTSADSGDKQCKIGVLAKRGIEKCLEKWGQTAEYLTKEIPGYSFEIKPLKFDEVVSAVEKGEVDFILANSSFFVELEYLYGTCRIATLNNLRMGEGYTVFGGVIFCRADRKDLKHLKDLKGKTFMAVKETSFGGWRMAWRELKEQGIDPYRDFTDLSFGGTHDAVVYAVRDGKVDAGTVRTDALERMDAEGKIDLEDYYVFHEHGVSMVKFSFLHSTRLYPEWPFAKVKHTPDKLAKNVAIALLEMSPDDPAARAAKCVGWVIPQQHQSVLECLKSLRASPFQDYGKITATDVIQKYWLWILAAVCIIVIIIAFAGYIFRLNKKLEKSIAEQKQEISNRKRAEEALNESEKRIRDLMASVPIGILISTPDGDVLEVNTALLKIFGYDSHAEFVNKPGEAHFYNSKDRERFVKLSNKGLAKGLELQFKRKDGSVFWGSITSAMVTTGADNTEFINAFEDITKRKRVEEDQKKLTELLLDSNDKLENALVERELAEKTLSETIDRYTAMINTVPALMFIKDIEGKYIEVNEAFCKFVDKSKDKIIGKNTREVYSNELAEKFYTDDKCAMDNDKEIINKDEHYVDDDGNIRWISSSRIPLHDSNGNISGLVGLIQEITDRHLIQEQLTQSDKLAAIGQLAAGVAHEINNPVGYINSNLNTMGKYLKKVNEYIEGKDESTPEDLDDLKEMLDDFTDAVNESLEGTDRVKRIVSDLKSFSRVDQAEKEHANINEGIESTLNVVWNELKYNCKVTKDFGEIPELFCMPNQINQVFMNLLVNAGHAIGSKGGEIKIKTWADTENIYVSIKDDGCGIPDKYLKKIFEPFFTTKEVGKGTGLGLSLTFDIIKKHKGTIDIISKVDVGTEFIITFPLEGIDEPKRDLVAG